MSAARSSTANGAVGTPKALTMCLVQALSSEIAKVRASENTKGIPYASSKAGT